jgi:hypothetical protein
MAIRKCSTSVQRVLTVSRRISQAKSANIPRNVREIVLQGFDLQEGFSTDEDTFTGPNTIERRGEFEPDGSHITIPYTASIRFGRPRPIAQRDRS